MSQGAQLMTQIRPRYQGIFLHIFVLNHLTVAAKKEMYNYYW